MKLPKSTCRYCPNLTRFVLVYMDDTEGLSVCKTHLGDGYEDAERANVAAFLPVHISSVRELVPA